MNTNETSTIAAATAPCIDTRPRIVGKVTTAQAYAACGLPYPTDTEISAPEIPAATQFQISNLKSEIPTREPASSIQHPAPALSVPSSETADTAAQQPASATRNPDASASSRSALAALQPLPGEGNTAYAAFMRFVAIDPPPNVVDFCRDSGFSRRSVTRWRDAYSWDNRIRRYLATRSAHFVTADSASIAAVVTKRESVAVVDSDLRAQSVRLARAALDSWLGAGDQPLTLQGVVRALDLACKLNPAADPADAIAAKSANEDFIARIERIYGAAGSAAANPAAEKLKNVSQTEPNSANVSQSGPN